MLCLAYFYCSFAMYTLPYFLLLIAMKSWVSAKRLKLGGIICSNKNYSAKKCLIPESLGHVPWRKNNPQFYATVVYTLTAVSYYWSSFWVNMFLSCIDTSSSHRKVKLAEWAGVHILLMEKSIHVPLNLFYLLLIFKKQLK